MRLLILLLTLIALQSSAQTDTIYKYFDAKWQPVQKDSAFFIGKIVKENNSWHRYDFWAKTGVKQFDGFYEEAETKTQNGPTRFFDEKGVLLDSLNYVHGKEMSKYIYYNNHVVKAYAFFDTLGNIIQMEGYDEQGKVIPGYIFQKEAEFPEGVKGWTNYLIKGLTTKQPKAYQQGKISGTVVVSFLVDKEGNVAEAQVITSSGYEELDEHALNVIRKSPKWIPAVQYNRKVIYRQKQSLTFSPQ